MPPLYEYRCPSCEKIVELVQGFNAPTSAICDCGEEAPRVLSQTGPWSFGGPTP
jgi:putative FmdB family regulatory protein